jgi:hypothetical protein
MDTTITPVLVLPGMQAVPSKRNGYFSWIAHCINYNICIANQSLHTTGPAREARCSFQNAVDFVCHAIRFGRKTGIIVTVFGLLLLYCQLYPILILSDMK